MQKYRQNYEGVEHTNNLEYFWIKKFSLKITQHEKYCFEEDSDLNEKFFKSPKLNLYHIGIDES